jgi:hypothetical protein
MSGFPGSPRTATAGFVRLSSDGAIERIVGFRYNPETLSRRLEATNTGAASVPAGAPAEPREVVSFRVVLDASDDLQQASAIAIDAGVGPQLAAIEQLMYAPTRFPDDAILLVWGRHRVVPVEVVELQIHERMFAPDLAPISADVDVTIHVLKAGDLGHRPHALRIWNRHLSAMDALAAQAPQTELADMGMAKL